MRCDIIKKTDYAATIAAGIVRMWEFAGSSHQCRIETGNTRP